MSFWKRLRAFAELFGIEFKLVSERDLSSKATTVPAAKPEPAVTDEDMVPVDATVLQAFVPMNLLEQLPMMTAKQIDRFEFGCIKVTDTGVVQTYNRWESEFAGVPQEAAIGKNFFRELAPCTNNRLIFGRFKEGVAANRLNTIISYAFTYKMRPTLVRVHLYRDPSSSTNWILVQKHEATRGK